MIKDCCTKSNASCPSYLSVPYMSSAQLRKALYVFTGHHCVYNFTFIICSSDVILSAMQVLLVSTWRTGYFLKLEKNCNLLSGHILLFVSKQEMKNLLSLLKQYPFTFVLIAFISMNEMPFFTALFILQRSCLTSLCSGIPILRHILRCESLKKTKGV